MRFVTPILVAALALAFAQPASADNKDKIIGQWKIVKGEEVPPGTMIEFTKAGKVVITVEINGKSMSLEIGEYKVDGDKVTLVAKKGGKDDTEVNTIKSLTDAKMVLVDPMKKEVELERVKAKK